MKFGIHLPQSGPAAAATESVKLGTTVLVLPLRPPVLLAKMLGTPDLMSGGRLIIGAAGGWMKEEFDALGVERLRRDRPEEAFTLSMRTRWDALDDDTDEINRDLDAFMEMGIQHIVVEPTQRDLEAWLRCSEAFSKLFERVR